MKTSTSRRAATLEAGSGDHDDHDDDGATTQRPQHGHPTSHEHLVRDVTASPAAAAGISAHALYYDESHILQFTDNTKIYLEIKLLQDVARLQEDLVNLAQHGPVTGKCYLMLRNARQHIWAIVAHVQNIS